MLVVTVLDYFTLGLHFQPVEHCLTSQKQIIEYFDCCAIIILLFHILVRVQNATLKEFCMSYTTLRDN